MKYIWLSSLKQRKKIFLTLLIFIIKLFRQALEPFYGRLAYERTAEISIYIDKNVQHENYRYHGLYF